MGSFFSDTFFQILLEFCTMFIFIFLSQILHNITNSCVFSDIGRNCLLGNRKKIAKFLMRTFTCRSTFLYGSHLWVYCHYRHRGVDAGHHSCKTTEYKSTDSPLPHLLNGMYCVRASLWTVKIFLAQY
jgi:hypothetical protein